MIPELDANRVRKWAADHTPSQYRDKVRIEVDETPRGLVVFECRPPWNDRIGPEWTRNPIARLAYVKKRNEWTLFWSDRNGKFHRYREQEPTRHVGELLDEIDADPNCIFWG